MQISTRFSLAVHILLCVGTFSSSQKMTSELLAGSAGVNPVVVRRVLGNLKKAGLVEVAAGTGGTTLCRSPESITLRDIYLAVEPVDEGRLFNMHEHPNPQCPVGRSINTLLEGHMMKAQQAMEASLDTVSLKELLGWMESSPLTENC